MLRNNTRIIAFNPRFSKLVTRECLEKLAGTRKGSPSNQNQQRTKAYNKTNNYSRNPTPLTQPLEDDFTQRLGRTKNAGVGRPESGPEPKSSKNSSRLGQHPQFEYRRAFRRRSQSLREHGSRQLLSVLHEEEISPDSPSSSSSAVEGSNYHDDTLVRTRNAKATGVSFCRFGNQDRSSTENSGVRNNSSGGNKRQLWKTRSKGFRSRVVATLIIVKDHYQHFLSSLNGEEVRREYSNLGGMVVNRKYDLQFAEDLDLAQNDRPFDNAGNEYRSVKGETETKL